MATKLRTSETIKKITPNVPGTQSKYFNNLRENLTKEDADKVAEYCLERYKKDKESKSVWEARYANWIRLAACNPLQDKKSEPWEGASNVLLPVLTIANTQFWARAMDAVYPARDIAKGVPVDPDKEEAVESALRVGKHLSHQILYKMPNFREGMSTSMMSLPLAGTVIRKTYYDDVRKTNVSEFVPPDKFVINYYTRYLETANCYTEELEESYNQMLVKENAGVYSSVTGLIPDTSSTDTSGSMPSGTSELSVQKDRISGLSKPIDDLYSMRKLLEMHIIIPLFDEEGRSIFGKPGGIGKRFIITIDEAARKVIRIIDPRYMEEETGKIIECEYYTKYGFLPSHDGSFYDVGFGLLLEANNETVNTIINQLIDAGHLANTQSGFINKRSGLSRGQIKMRRGEFQEVNVGPDGLQGAIMPLQFNPPSQVLFQLLTLLQDYANRVTTVSDVFTGEMPRSDTSATAITTTVEQGLKVFSSVYAGLHQSFAKELKKLFVLNGIYADAEDYFDVNGSSAAVELLGPPDPEMKMEFVKRDYKNSRSVIPASDPNAISKVEKVQKAQGVYQIVTTNPVTAGNPMVMLAALERLLQVMVENGYEVQQILAPVKEQIAQQKQVQQVQQQQMQAQQADAQAQHLDALQRIEAAGAHKRQLEEGHIPQQLVQGFQADMNAVQQEGEQPQ